MKKFLSLILSAVSIANVSAQTASQPASAQPPKIWYEQKLYLRNIQAGSDNPVSISNNPYSLLNSFNGSYTQREGSFKPINGEQKGTYTDIDIYGTKKLQKISFEGSMSYGVHDLHNSRWDNTVLLTENNPFIIADSLVYDSIPNNQNREFFNLNGGFAWNISENFTIGLKSTYMVGSKADQSDPRFKSNAARVSVVPGLEYRFSNKFSAGLSALVENYNETIGMTVQDNLIPGHENTFLFQELGVYTLMTNYSYNRRYEGRKYEGAAQITTRSNAISSFSQFKFGMNKEEAIDGGTSYEKRGGDFSDMYLVLNERLQFNIGRTINNFTLNGSYSKAKGKNFKQATKLDKYGSTEWYVQSAEITQIQKDIKASLCYRTDFMKESNSMLALQADAALEQINHRQYPDEYYATYSLLKYGMTVEKRFIWGKTGLELKAKGEMCNNLKEFDYSLPTTAPGKKKLMKAYFLPKYEYLSAAYTNAVVSADFSYYLTGRNGKAGSYAHIKLQYGHTDYTGDYSRFNDRNTAMASFGLTF